MGITKIRKYQPIWEALKENNEATLKAPISSHSRIIQAVRKEGSKDAGWRYLLLEEGMKYKIKIEIVKKYITFKLIREPIISVQNL